MKILAVDSSTRHLSLAVLEDDKVLTSRSFHPKKDLSLTITFDIERVLQKANVFLHDLDGFVIGLGPGSFTGLRVGMSMMKAFIMVTEKPVAGVSSLDAIAMNVKSKKPTQVCVISDARRNQVYACLYDKHDHTLHRKSEYLLKPIDEVVAGFAGEIVFIGDGVPHSRDRIADLARSGRFHPTFEPEKHWLPKASELGRLGYQRLLNKETDNIQTLAPMYLYPEDCQVSRK